MSPLARHPRSAARGRTSGVSLVELMVALGVGVVVVMGLTQMLASTNATYAREEQFARLQENGRIAALMLAREMRPNRSLDCMSAVQHTPTSLHIKACDLLEGSCDGDHFLGPDRAMGYDGGDDLSDAGAFSDLPTAVAGNVAERWVLGDVLVTWGVEPNGTAVDGHPVGSNPIELEGKPGGMKVGTLALVSNCVEDAYVFEVSGPQDDGEDAGTTIEHGGNDNARAELKTTGGPAYQVPVAIPPDGRPRWMLYPLVYKVFYVCCTSNGELQSGNPVTKCQPNGGDYDPDQYRPALCVYDIQEGRSQVLVPDVADLRVTYTGNSEGKPTGAIDFQAEDTSPIPTAAWVTDADAWAGVRSASVELLMTTEAAHTASAASEPARSSWPPGGLDADTLGADYAADHRLYQRFRFDVAFRSATPWYVTK
jgi:hypothetical protein